MTTNVTVNDLANLSHHDGQIVLHAKRDDFEVEVRAADANAKSSTDSFDCPVAGSTRGWPRNDQHRRKLATWRRECGARGRTLTRSSDEQRGGAAMLELSHKRLRNRGWQINHPFRGSRRETPPFHRK